MIPVHIPELQDKELYAVLRKISQLAVAMDEILSTGTTLPTSGKKKFFYKTDTEQLLFYTGSGWKIVA